MREGPWYPSSKPRRLRRELTIERPAFYPSAMTYDTPRLTRPSDPPAPLFNNLRSTGDGGVPLSPQWLFNKPAGAGGGDGKAPAGLNVGEPPVRRLSRDNLASSPGPASPLAPGLYLRSITPTISSSCADPRVSSSFSPLDFFCSDLARCQVIVNSALVGDGGSVGGGGGGRWGHGAGKGGWKDGRGNDGGSRSRWREDERETPGGRGGRSGSWGTGFGGQQGGGKWDGPAGFEREGRGAREVGPDTN